MVEGRSDTSSLNHNMFTRNSSWNKLKEKTLQLTFSINLMNKLSFEEILDVNI